MPILKELIGENWASVADGPTRIVVISLIVLCLLVKQMYLPKRSKLAVPRWVSIWMLLLVSITLIVSLTKIKSYPGEQFTDAQKKPSSQSVPNPNYQASPSIHVDKLEQKSNSGPMFGIVNGHVEVNQGSAKASSSRQDEKVKK